MSDTGRGVTAKMLLALGSVVGTLAAVEIALLLFHPVPFSIEKNMYFEADPHTGFRLKPGGKGFFRGGIRADANRHGHRSDEIPLVKGDGTFRIMVLGDSFTVGASVEQSETYASVLQDQLNRGSRVRFEVINAGVGGWGPFQYAQYYEYYGRKFDPDLILVGFFVGNDIFKTVRADDPLPSAEMGRRLSPGVATDRFVKLKIALHENSHLFRLLTNRSASELSAERASCDEFPELLLRIERGRREVHRKDSEKLARRTIQAVLQILRIQRLARADGIPLLVLLFPDENQINPALQAIVFREPERYDFELPQSLLKDRFGTLGIELLDLLPSFRADQRCLFQNDPHWNAEGHALVAQKILERIAPYLPRNRASRPRL